MAKTYLTVDLYHCGEKVGRVRTYGGNRSTIRDAFETYKNADMLTLTDLFPKLCFLPGNSLIIMCRYGIIEKLLSSTEYRIGDRVHTKYITHNTNKDAVIESIQDIGGGIVTAFKYQCLSVDGNGVDLHFWRRKSDILYRIPNAPKININKLMFCDKLIMMAKPSSVLFWPNTQCWQRGKIVYVVAIEGEVAQNNATEKRISINDGNINTVITVGSVIKYFRYYKNGVTYDWEV